MDNVIVFYEKNTVAVSLQNPSFLRRKTCFISRPKWENELGPIFSFALATPWAMNHFQRGWKNFFLSPILLLLSNDLSSFVRKNLFLDFFLHSPRIDLIAIWLCLHCFMRTARSLLSEDTLHHVCVFPDSTILPFLLCSFYSEKEQT